MPSFNRLSGSITTLLVVASSSAYAEEPKLTDPPEETLKCDNDVPENCPPTTTTPPPAPQPAPMAEPTPMPAPDVDVVVSEPELPWYETMGIGLSIGGGVDDFVGDGFTDATGIGGGWNVRATFGTRSLFALEGSYIGSAQDIETFGAADDATLYGNGLQAAGRLNILPQESVQPFLYAGVAWRHYDISDTLTADVDDSDDVFEVPVGLGLAGYVAGLMADVRAEYRGAWGADLVPSIDDDGAIISEMDRWGITGSLGAEF
jgi:hypothetical protein